MTLRRYVRPKPSRGTAIPPLLRIAVLTRDGGCVGSRIGMPENCYGAIELDHIRASGGLGMKSRTEAGNLVSLCAIHHRIKTLNGREWRPRLLDYIESPVR